MKCIQCGGETQIIESRDSDETIRRRRECLVCHCRFTTKEVTIEDYKELMAWKTKKLTMEDYAEFIAWKKKKDEHAKYLLAVAKQREYNQQHKLQYLKDKMKEGETEECSDLC